jgi:alanine dehydrogenase
MRIRQDFLWLFVYLYCIILHQWYRPAKFFVGRSFLKAKAMVIGVPTEIKSQEFRVGLTPAGVQSFHSAGHKVFIQQGAGLGSGFLDSDYEKAGGQILPDAPSIYVKADMIIKVKEPLPTEYALIKPNQILFTYFHFAASKSLTDAMMKSHAICIAYETVELTDRSLPLLTPMSEVAGRLAIQFGAYYLGKPQGGKGKLLGGVPGVKPAKVLILGGGVVGTQAAKMAAGLGAQVVIFDTNLARLRYLTDVLPANVQTEYSTQHAIEAHLPSADLIVGAVLLHGAKAPHLIKKEHLSQMEAGTVLVDVAVDQGGCIETCRPTTHENPVFEIDGIIHYCVANMPGAVPQTSTMALTQATLPYALQIANLGWEKACDQHEALNKGLSICQGKILKAEIA